MQFSCIFFRIFCTRFPITLAMIVKMALSLQYSFVLSFLLSKRGDSVGILMGDRVGAVQHWGLASLCDDASCRPHVISSRTPRGRQLGGRLLTFMAFVCFLIFSFLFFSLLLFSEIMFLSYFLLVLWLLFQNVTDIIVDDGVVVV